MYFLGIDTSNYTTSTAIYDSETNRVVMSQKLLPVKDNQVGLRQSDAVFLHVKQLADLLKKLFETNRWELSAIGVSTRPRAVDGSYMPCFLVGELVASALSTVLDIPLYTFSHQDGHLAAAIYSADCPELFEQTFYAFHVSGGTTEGLRVTGKGTSFESELLVKTRDLNAGQVIDRVGVAMGLSFPCGKELERLAQTAPWKKKVKATLKEGDCCLSGIENQCMRKLSEGASKAEVAAFCLTSVQMAIVGMTEYLLEKERLPVLYAGGVMSNAILRDDLAKRFDATFAAPAFSTDNSGGIAVLGARAFFETGSENQ